MHFFTRCLLVLLVGLVIDVCLQVKIEGVFPLAMTINFMLYYFLWSISLEETLKESKEAGPCCIPVSQILKGCCARSKDGKTCGKEVFAFVFDHEGCTGVCFEHKNPTSINWVD